jgi:transcription antitermination factor NusG
VDNAQPGGQEQADNSGGNGAKWYVLWTCSHCEHRVQEQLLDKGFDAFLPIIEGWARRDGFRRRVRSPMFPGYLFLRHRMDADSYVAASNVPGVVRFLGEGWNRLAAVPEPEMAAVRRVAASGLPVRAYGYLTEGQRVRITQGALAGLEGVFLRDQAHKGLVVISVGLLQRSVAVETGIETVEGI